MTLPELFINGNKVEVKEIPWKGVQVGETFVEYSEKDFVWVNSAEEQDERTSRFIELKQKTYEQAKLKEIKRLRYQRSSGISKRSVENKSLWIPTREAVKHFGIHKRTLQRWARSGKVETIQSEDGKVFYKVE